MKTGPVRLTIADIAKAAGVSVTTVSFVLSGKAKRYRISEAVESEIRTIADELGYSPNQLARGLRAQSTEIIGVVSLGSEDPYGYMYVEAIEECADGDNLSTFIGYSRRDLATLEHRIRQFCDWHVAGIIFEWVPGFEDTKTFRLLNDHAPCPAVAIRVHIPDSNIVNVGFDHQQILEETIQRCVALGHKRIVVVDSVYPIEDRDIRKHYLDRRLTELGPDFAADVLQLSHSEEEVASALRELFCRPIETRPTAVVAYSQGRANGAFTAAESCGLSVPEDISILSITGYKQQPIQRARFDQYWYDHRALGRRAYQVVSDRVAGTYGGPVRVYETAGRWLEGETFATAPIG